MAWIALIGPELENLSLRYLASSLKAAGHEARIIAYNAEPDFATVIESVLDPVDPPLLVGLSLAFQWRAPDFLAVAVALRELGYRGHVTAGGHFATFAAADLLRDFPALDSICRQEAEETLVRLTAAVAAGQPFADIPGIASRDAAGAVVMAPLPAIPDLAALPWPDRSGEPARCFNHGIAPIVSSRGCYANCTFCCIAAWHEADLPGKRYRLRSPEDVAAEMAALRRERGIDIFVFHDDNFFIPNRSKSLERIEALADAIAAEGLEGFGTVVKARPNDVDPEVFRVLVERLVIRYVGIETDADQGLVTLRRWGKSTQNHHAIEVARDLDLFVCFNMLLFDPDTTLDSIETNIGFIEYAPEMPFNFGRVELYAGTPLLARMQAEGRCSGDYLQWDYRLHDPEVERLFHLAMACFRRRNLGDRALANDIQALRFDLEICRKFHPDALDPELLVAGRELSTRLSLDTAAGLRELLAHVRSDADPARDRSFTADLARRLRATERAVRAEMDRLARRLHREIDHGLPLSFAGNRVATPLQRAVSTLEVTP